MINFGNSSKIASILIIILLALLYIFFNKKVVTLKYNEYLLELLKKTEYKFIAHATGGIDEKIYTNSLEAIILSIFFPFLSISIIYFCFSFFVL